MKNLTLLFSVLILMAPAAPADVDGTRVRSQNIDVFKGLDPARPEALEEELAELRKPSTELGQGQEDGRSYMTCETHTGQKFREGQFGYDDCLREKKDEARMRSSATPPPGTAPSIESLRFNIDHTFSF